MASYSVHIAIFPCAKLDTTGSIAYHGSHARVAHIECIAQLSDEEARVLSRNIGHIATCDACKMCSYCPICALGGSILLTEIRALSELRDDCNRSYVFALIGAWKARRQSKSR